MAIFADRRSTIACGLAAALFPSCAAAREIDTFHQPETPNVLVATLDLQRFLTLGAEDFRSWLPARSPQEHAALIRAIAAQASRMNEIAMPQLVPMGAEVPGIEIGSIGHGWRFALIAYRAAPNAAVPAHNHPNYSVATLGISGEATVCQFEADAAAPPMSSSEPFHVRKTSHRLLRRGDLATLTPTVDNIHTFKAGASGAAWIDIIVANGPDVGFSYLSPVNDADILVGERLSVRWTRP